MLLRGSGRSTRTQREKVNNLKGDLDQTKTNISDTKDHIREIDDRLRIVQIRRSEKTTAEGIPNRKAGDIRGDIQEVRKEASRELVKAGTPLYAVQSLEYTLSELRNYPNKESYPENSGHFHRGTPRKGECICGEDLTEDHREHLLSLQQEMSTVVETNLEGRWQSGDAARCRGTRRDAD